MALPISIPNTFATETTNIPLSDLDANFTTVADAVNGIGDGSEPLANVAITGGAITGGTINGAVIGGSNAVAGTFSTLTATTYTGGGIAPTGSLTMWAGAVASPPTGWLACNGANVSRSTYSALFAVVGTSFGIGDNATTFGLPNLLNRFPVGAGDTYALAATGGSANAIVVSHTHTANSAVTDPGHTHFIAANVYDSSEATLTASNQVKLGDSGAVDTRYKLFGTSTAATLGLTSNATTGVTVVTTNSTEGSSATNANLPPYVAVGFIIKT
jgi:microcystin-dependent protein